MSYTAVRTFSELLLLKFLESFLSGSGVCLQPYSMSLGGNISNN
jgi:hypothetical protein